MVRRWLAGARERIAVRVPGKINLFLAVRGVRNDAFHELTTVLQTVSLHDTVWVRLAGPPSRSQHPAARRRMELEVRCDVDGVPCDARNLAILAARALGHATNVLADAGDDASDDSDGNELAAVPPRLEWLPAEGPRTILEIDKSIPPAAGLAGGSANAAAALLALNELWGCDLENAELRTIGAQVGSDVPFCVVGGTALASGRGEALAQVLCRGRFHWVIGVDEQPLSTADVYRSWDAHCTPSEIEPDAVLAALVAGDAEALGAALHNELQPAAMALRPDLADRRAALLEAGALGAVMAGSGPTLLGLARDAEHAQRLASAVVDRFATVHVATSPAGGPEPAQA